MYMYMHIINCLHTVEVTGSPSTAYHEYQGAAVHSVPPFLLCLRVMLADFLFLMQKARPFWILPPCARGPNDGGRFPSYGGFCVLKTRNRLQGNLLSVGQVRSREMSQGMKPEIERDLNNLPLIL